MDACRNSPTLIIKSKRSDPRDGSQKDGSLEPIGVPPNRIKGILKDERAVRRDRLEDFV